MGLTRRGLFACARFFAFVMVDCWSWRRSCWSGCLPRFVLGFTVASLFWFWFVLVCWLLGLLCCLGLRGSLPVGVGVLGSAVFLVGWVTCRGFRFCFGGLHGAKSGCFEFDCCRCFWVCGWF